VTAGWKSSVATTLSVSERSRYDVLRRFLANKLNVAEDNVDIFTVRNHPTLKKTIDIRYSAHGSPYYRPEKLDGMITLNKEEVGKLYNYIIFLHCNVGFFLCAVIDEFKDILIEVHVQLYIKITIFVLSRSMIWQR